MNYDIIILGAGIVGAACAYECTLAGLSAAVVEPRIVGGGATAAGMGHIVTMDDSEAQFALTRYSQQLWNALAPQLPQDCEFRHCGTLWVAADDEEMAEVRRKAEFYEMRGVPVEILDEQQLAAAEPNLRCGLPGALRVRQDGVIYPPCAAKFLLEQSGAELIAGRAAVEIKPHGVELDDGTQLSSAAIVNATGHWSPELTPGIAVKKRKGHLVITDRYPYFVYHQLIELGYLKNAHTSDSDSVAFNAQPRATGQILLGSSRQFGAETSESEPQMVKAMLQRAAEYMPNIGQLSALRIWTGFRAATPDHLPLIGRLENSALSTQHSALYLATGHEGLGITTSLGTAQIIADLLTGRETAIDAAPYSPNRNITING
jgi:glycine/D-amino acid oxidase-like deaminating enzyme